MKIKNTKELVLRAKGHAKLDEVARGVYGEISTNATVKFRGCAIGCLAMPHTRKELRELAREWGVNRNGQWYATGWFDFDDEAMVEALEREFGICEDLARLAEECFEAQSGDTAPSKFVVAFARALNEGAEINAKKVGEVEDKIREEIGNDYGVVEAPEKWAAIALRELATIKPARRQRKASKTK